MPESSPSSLSEATPSAPDSNGAVRESGGGISFRNILWPLLISLTVLGIIGYMTFDPGSLRHLGDMLNPWWLVAAAATVALRVVFGGWRLNLVAHGRLGMLGGVRGQLAWDFFSNVTPSTIGGGPFAAGYLASDRGLPLGEATAIMLFSMLLDQLWFSLSVPIILIGGLYFEIIPASLGTIGVWTFTLYFMVLLAWVTTFGYFTLFRPQMMERLVERLCEMRLLRRFRERATRVMAQHRDRAAILRSQRLGFYLKGFLLTAGTWICRYALIVFIILSVYPALDGVLAFLRSIAITLGSLVMPTPGGAGGLEGLYALFLGPPLVPEAFVAPTLLAWRILGYYIFIAIGVFLSTHQVQQSIRRRKVAQMTDGDGYHGPDVPVFHEELTE